MATTVNGHHSSHLSAGTLQSYELFRCTREALYAFTYKDNCIAPMILLSFLYSNPYRENRFENLPNPAVACIIAARTTDYSRERAGPVVHRSPRLASI